MFIIVTHYRKLGTAYLGVFDNNGNQITTQEIKVEHQKNEHSNWSLSSIVKNPSFMVIPAVDRIEDTITYTIKEIGDIESIVAKHALRQVLYKSAEEKESALDEDQTYEKVFCDEEGSCGDCDCNNCDETEDECSDEEMDYGMDLTEDEEEEINYWIHSVVAHYEGEECMTQEEYEDKEHEKHEEFSIDSWDEFVKCYGKYGLDHPGFRPYMEEYLQNSLKESKKELR